MSRSQNRHDTLRWKRRRKGFWKKAQKGYEHRVENKNRGHADEPLRGGNHKDCLKSKYQNKHNQFKNKADKQIFYMVQINKIKPPTFELYDPNDNFLGIINEYELLDIRIQIKKAQVKGYYIKQTDDTVKREYPYLEKERTAFMCIIDKDGELDCQLDELELMGIMICELIL